MVTRCRHRFAGQLIFKFVFRTVFCTVISYLHSTASQNYCGHSFLSLDGRFGAREWLYLIDSRCVIDPNRFAIKKKCYRVQTRVGFPASSYSLMELGEPTPVCCVICADMWWGNRESDKREICNLNQFQNIVE